jgi:(+)-trans-carveol dehydrogenase
MIDNDEVGALFMPGRAAGSPEDRRAAMAEVLTPIKMLPIPWIEAEDVSNLVAFLAGDESRYITGTTMRVDGGYSAK